MPKPRQQGEGVIVGRTNVGKSTLFNRLTGRPRAIVSAQAGTTRDRNRGPVTWLGKRWWFVDTGGFEKSPGDPLSKEREQQVELALASAAAVLLVVDAQTGLTQEDRTLAKRVQRLPGYHLLVVNKADSNERRLETAGLSLGFRDVVFTSARNGSGVGDLLELVAENVPAAPEAAPTLKLALLGQTNVGKSSILNQLAGEERAIVHPSPHTTRDRLSSFIVVDGTTIEIIDTAGLRRQRTHSPQLEQQAVAQTLEALTEVDAVALVLDGSAEPTWQDQHVGGLIQEAGVAALVLMNKCDLVPFDTARKAALRRARPYLPMLEWARVAWVSAQTGEGIKGILPAAHAAASARRTRLTTEELERFTAYLHRTPPTRDLPVFGFTQTRSEPPQFVLHLKTKEDLRRAVATWVVGKLRDKFKLEGTPVRVVLRGLRKG